MNHPLILAIDIGSSSVRAGIYDGKAKPVSGTGVKIDWAFKVTPDGGSEMDAEPAFRTVVSAIDSVLAKSAKLKGDIQVVASCAFWHSLVGVDEKGKPTTKVFGWADTRSRKYSGVLRKQFDESKIRNRTGAHFHSSFWPAKLLWLRKEFPEVFAKTGKWLSFSDYVLGKLTESNDTSVSMASATGIFDFRNCEWNVELIRYLKIKPKNLPEITQKQSFRLSVTYRRRWPLLKNTAIFPAIGDGAADNIGSGCVTKNKAALMVGTSAAMRVAYNGEPPAKIPDGLWCYRVDRKRVIIGGALSDGGNLYQWLRSNLKFPKNVDSEIVRRRRSIKPLPTFVPFLHGERSLGYNEQATGGIADLAAAHDSIDILHAAMVSVADQLREICHRLEQVVEIKQIVFSGGALRESRIWRQIIAEVMGRKLTDNKSHESSLRGAVLLALENTGRIESIEALETDK